MGVIGEGDATAGDGSGAPAKSANPARLCQCMNKLVIEIRESHGGGLGAARELWGSFKLNVPASSPAGTGDGEGEGLPPRIFWMKSMMSGFD